MTDIYRGHPENFHWSIFVPPTRFPPDPDVTIVLTHFKLVKYPVISSIVCLDSHSVTRRQDVVIDACHISDLLISSRLPFCQRRRRRFRNTHTRVHHPITGRATHSLRCKNTTNFVSRNNSGHTWPSRWLSVSDGRLEAADCLGKISTLCRESLHH